MQVLLLQYGDRSLFTCSGSLITPSTVLSAAHCCSHILNNIKNEGDTYEDYSALGGTPNISYKTQYSKEIFFKDINVHENYRPPTKSDQAALNDICLIYLKQKFKLTNAISIMELDENLEFPTSGTNCFISGWGLDQVAFRN